MGIFSFDKQEFINSISSAELEVLYEYALDVRAAAVGLRDGLEAQHPGFNLTPVSHESVAVTSTTVPEQHSITSTPVSPASAEQLRRTTADALSQTAQQQLQADAYKQLDEVFGQYGRDS